MRTFIAAGLIGAAVVSLAACGKPAPGAGGAAAPGAAAAAGGSGPLTPAQFPHRKPGLWTQVMGFDGPPSGPGTKLCVDDASEARMNAFAQKMPGGGHCDVQVSRNLDGSMDLSSACDMGANGKATTTGVVKGDFNSSFTETMRTTFVGSPVASLNGAHTMTVIDTWTGPCASGQRGGDIIMGDRVVRNVLDDEAKRAGPNTAAN